MSFRLSHLSLWLMRFDFSGDSGYTIGQVRSFLVAAAARKSSR